MGLSCLSHSERPKARAAFQVKDTNAVKLNNFLVFGKLKTQRPLKNMFEVHFTHRKLRLGDVSARSLSVAGKKAESAPRAQSPKPHLSKRLLQKMCKESG